MIDPTQFRTDFPEFADSGQYSDARIQFFLALGYKQFDPCVWDSLLDYGVELYVAHNLYLAKLAMLQAAGGGVPGTPIGVITAQTVGPVSTSFDAALGTSEGMGYYAKSNYGQILWSFIEGAAGVVQL